MRESGCGSRVMDARLGQGKQVKEVVSFGLGHTQQVVITGFRQRQRAAAGLPQPAIGRWTWTLQHCPACVLAGCR
jgi:hypothetical protein